MKKRVFSLLLAVMMVSSLMIGCSSTPKAGKVYYLNFKPESEATWQEIAKAYKEETGVEVKVQTAAAGTYEQTLKSEISKKDAPTLFQINGPVGYQSWKQYCLDLKDTDIYSWLYDKTSAISDGDGVYGIPFVQEGYGIIYNDAIMQKYIALPDKATDITAATDIKSFDTLKAVAEDMTAKKDALGIKGVFGSTSLKPGEDWRWQTHLASIPVFYEYKDDGVSDKTEIALSYSDNFKNIFDLYINNSVTDPKMLGGKSVKDSMSELALGQVAMIQNGNWGWGDISSTDGNTVKPEDVKFLPIYIGAPGEEKQGLCIGTENYFCINSKASEADQKASIDFMQWLYNTEKGKNYVTNDLGFIAPFNTFNDSEKPSDPLAQEILKDMANTETNTVLWSFLTFPSQTFKDAFGAALLEYAQGTKTWDDVKNVFVTQWAEEKAAAAQ